jgi:hypothetical protein
LNRIAHLFEGLTVRRVIAVTVISFCATLVSRAFFTNTIVELLLIALCIGYTSMLFFTIATNLHSSGIHANGARCSRSSSGASSGRSSRA